MKPDFVERLLRPGVYSHPVTGPQLHETHISWVVLTGEYAYKIKKPVRFGFVDFSTLADRRRDCERELALNEAMSPGMYLSVEPICDAGDGHLRVGGTSGRIVEYAVKMRQFEQEAMFSRMAARGALGVEHVEALADRVATIHRAAAVSTHEAYGSRDQVGYWHEDNLAQIASILAGSAERRFADLASRVRCMHLECAESFDDRRDAGFVRDCHGDLHLANILWLSGDAVLFDRIEFNDELRFIDVANDTAFTAMDLHHVGRADLAWRFFNRYLLRSGDFGALAVHRFYMVYRALVRAKVALLGCKDEDKAARGDVDGFRTHVELVASLLDAPPASLAITCGLSGSGKTTRALQEAADRGAVVVHTDVERKRMASVDVFTHADSELEAGIYSPEFSRRVYERVGRIARSALDAGYRVIVDGAFLRRADRDRFRRLAGERDAGFSIIYCGAPVEELRRRIVARRRDISASDADLAVLEHQLSTAELPDAAELSDMPTE